MLTEKDRKHLKRAVELAREALEKGDAPFGSVLVSGEGEVLMEARNQVGCGDHTQHPEFNLARWAAEHMTDGERRKATVYTSGEHCPMCSAAHGWVDLGRIVYASSSAQLAYWLEEMGIPPAAYATSPSRRSSGIRSWKGLFRNSKRRSTSSAAVPSGQELIWNFRQEAEDGFYLTPKQIDCTKRPAATVPFTANWPVSCTPFPAGRHGL